MSEHKDTTRLNREIIAEELYNARVASGTEFDESWRQLNDEQREKFALQADYLLSKFRMILIEEEKIQHLDKD